MIVALNNKSNLDKNEFIKYLEELSTIETNHKMVLCPTSINIPLFNLNIIELGAQNVSNNLAGPHTGEVNADQLKSYDVKYCLVGHSERREEQHITSQDTNKKIKLLLENHITPILCVGETKEQRIHNNYKAVVREEVLTAIKDLSEEDVKRIIIAYEPIYSIGTGIIPTNDEIVEVLDIIKKILPENKVLYGGSANEENIDTLKEIDEIDGFLLGGLSIKVHNLKLFLKKI
jgi:triosephosphate isomerase